MIFITRPKVTNALPKSTTSNAAIAAKAAVGIVPTDSIKTKDFNPGVSLRAGLSHSLFLFTATRTTTADFQTKKSSDNRSIPNAHPLNRKN